MPTCFPTLEADRIVFFRDGLKCILGFDLYLSVDLKGCPRSLEFSHRMHGFTNFNAKLLSKKKFLTHKLSFKMVFTDPSDIPTTLVWTQTVYWRFPRANSMIWLIWWHVVHQFMWWLAVRYALPVSSTLSRPSLTIVYHSYARAYATFVTFSTSRIHKFHFAHKVKFNFFF